MIDSPQLLLNLVLDQQASFDNYFPANNGLLIDALKDFIDNDEFIIAFYGTQFSGCSHLLNACCLEAETRGLQSMLIPMAEFVQMPTSVIQGLDNYKLVCIDDIEQLAGNTGWEEALFYLVNRMKLKGNKLIIGSHQTIQHIPFKLADLQSRLLWGGTYTLEPMSDSQLSDFIVFYANKKAMNISADVADYIINRVDRSLKEVLAILNKLEKRTLIERRRVTIPFVKAVCGI